ncbi:MAG: alpha/beta hydrolase [Leptospirales bacterium]|nr:alpha/beta hydrolase [Leptospirales bacterium]
MNAKLFSSLWRPLPGRALLAWRRHRHLTRLRDAGFQFHFHEFEGLRFHAMHGGDPEKPALVLLHGFLDSCLSFRRLAPELARRYHIIAPDTPGFGRSFLPAMRDIWRIPLMARALAGLLVDRLQLPAFTLLTHSLGGLVAAHLQLYLQSCKRQEFVKAVHMLAPGVLRLQPEERERLRRMVYPQTRAEVRQLIDAFYIESAPQLPDLIVDGLLWDWARPGYAYLASNTIEEEERTFLRPAQLGQLQAPQHIYWCEREAVLPAWNARALRKLCSGRRGWRYTNIAGSGHAAHLEHPERVLAALRL